MRASSYRAYLLWACLGQVLGCSPRPTQVSVGRIVIDAPRTFDDKETARDQLRHALIARLSRASGVTLDPKNPSPTHVLQVVLSELIAPADAPPSRIVEVRLRATGDAPAFMVSARPQEESDIVKTALAGFDLAWPQIAALRALDVARDATLLKALNDPNPQVREFAIERVGERHLRAAVLPLCKLLASESEPTLVLKGIGALVMIGDERAVEPLIELAHQKDPGFVTQIVFAVGSIGGRTAKAYLVTVAGGHPEEDVRRGARDALLELSRRDKDTPLLQPGK